VGTAGGTIGGGDDAEAELIGRDGKALATGGAPALAWATTRRSAVQPADLKSGRGRAGRARS
jgi:hypothetical protein